MTTDTNTPARPVVHMSPNDWRDLMRAANNDKTQDHRAAYRAKLKARHAARLAAAQR